MTELKTRGELTMNIKGLNLCIVNDEDLTLIDRAIESYIKLLKKEKEPNQAYITNLYFTNKKLQENKAEINIEQY